MKIIDHLDKNKLHHAYLIESTEEEATEEVLKFVESLGVSTIGNPDFCHIAVDSFKVEDARNLKSFGGERGFSSGKKIFLISANSFLLEAQNTLLKIFEEPIENTHFFLITPDTNALLSTFISRFYLIRARQGLTQELKVAEEFIGMSRQKRIDFLKELLTEAGEEDEEGNEILSKDSTRSKALKFLNTLEVSLHNKLIKNFSSFSLPEVPGGTYAVQNSLQACLMQIFKVRKFLRMPGSSAKNLMESVALSIPNL